MKLCQNCVFTYPTPDFEMKDKDGNVINSFYHDPGHSEVKIDWNKLFSETHNITDKSTKNGRAIIILRRKDYKEKLVKEKTGYFNKEKLVKKDLR
jgi:hypothetical protein